MRERQREEEEKEGRRERRKRRKEEGGGGEKNKKGERNIDLLFHLLMHSLVDSYRCPDWKLNPASLAYQDDGPTN